MHANAPDIVRSLPELRARVAAWRVAGQKVAVVPTMGALHAGHLSLVTQAAETGAKVIVTLFVNPRQFNNPADLAAYPRTELEDAAKLATLPTGRGADVLYVPDGETMYPKGFATEVAVAGLSEGMCGAFRPGHFTGMATVVTKLFTQTAADLAFFGEKDFQQLKIVQRLAADLDLPIAVIGCSTVRETDGLAMSSRNIRLSVAARGVAPVLYAQLAASASALALGADFAEIQREATARIVAGGYQAVEYLELRREADLVPTSLATMPSRLLAAAWLDGIRLIDNVQVIARAE
jgi:pantoate--beta-alanine ligase